MKIALVHDDFIQAGGAESLFATIASLFPQSPIYTSLVDWHKLPSSINRDRVRTSFIQRIPFAQKFYKLLLPLYPFAFESFNFDDFDLVISSTTRFAKSIITKPNTIHICYINSVPRFLWDEEKRTDYLSPLAGFILKPLTYWLKRWDKAAAARADYFIANSKNVAAGIKTHYGVESQVVYPFADLSFFAPAKRYNWHLKSQNYLLIVTRLVKWKKIDIAIEAVKTMGINLKIVGLGPDEARLKRLSTSVIPAPASPAKRGKKAGIQILDQVENDNADQIEFLGLVTRQQLRQLYQNTQALIITQKEDFGIAAVEAQACGKPIIAYSFGGQQEIIKDSKTGIFFTRQSKDSLKDAIIAASHVKWGVSTCRRNALRFSKSNFIKSFKKIINDQIEKH